MRNWKALFGNLFSKQFESGGVTGRDFIDEARLRSKDTPELSRPFKTCIVRMLLAYMYTFHRLENKLY